MDESYRDIADSYDRTFSTLSFRIPIEEHSVLQLLGDVRGRSILEVACGTGHYTRALLRNGAARVEASKRDAMRGLFASLVEPDATLRRLVGLPSVAESRQMLEVMVISLWSAPLAA